MSGGTGLLGGEILRRSAHDSDHSFVSIGRTAPRDVDHISDSMDRSSLPHVGDVDAVLHLVQSDRFRELPTGLANVTAVNTLSTARLLEVAMAAGANRFVLASSGAVYSDAERGELAEDSSISPYAASRRAAELLALSVSGAIDIVVLRYFFIYGRRQDRRMLIPRVVDRVREGLPVTLDGEDGLSLNPIHVSDAARLTEIALTTSPGIYDVCGPEVVTLRDIGEIAGYYLGRSCRFEPTGRSSARVVAAYRPDLLGEALVRPQHGLREVCQAVDGQS